MKKQLVIIGIVAILVSVVLSGCIDNNTVSSKTYEEKILGQWTATISGTPITVIMNFFTNGSFYEGINETTVIWGTYTMTGKTIALHYGAIIHTVEYSFSNNDNTLTLKETSDGGVYLVLIRQ
jgi:outer membrane lipoprotein SlyB